MSFIHLIIAQSGTIIIILIAEVILILDKNTQMLYTCQLIFCFFLPTSAESAESLMSRDLFSPLTFLVCSLLKSCLFMCTRPSLLPNTSCDTFFTFLGYKNKIKNTWKFRRLVQSIPNPGEPSYSACSGTLNNNCTHTKS